MEISSVISKVEITLILSFSELDNWFNKPDELKSYIPQKGWNIRQILEHVAITNFYLLDLIHKESKKAKASASLKDLEQLLHDYKFRWDELNSSGNVEGFNLTFCNEQEPSGELDQEEVKSLLRYQMRKCIGLLRRLSNGEGLLQKVPIAVRTLGEVNIYEYLYFLAQHIRRHIIQLEKIEEEYEYALMY